MTDVEEEGTIYAFAYARVSTKDKDQDPESQLHAIRQWAKKKGNINIVKEFQDKATGTNADRDALNSMFGYKLQYPNVSKILIHDADRLSRNMDDAPYLISQFNKFGLTITYITDESIDLTTKEGKLMNSLKSYSAQAYTDGLKDKIRAGMAKAKDQGKHIGRPSKRGDDSINVDMLMEFAKQGYSLRKLEKVYKVSRNTLVRRLKDEGRYEEFKQIQEFLKTNDN